MLPTISSLPPTASVPGSSTGLLAPHVLLNQRYRILSLLGKGGMGAVYKAADTRLGDRPVAVKEMIQSDLKSPQEIIDAAEAFKHEALMLANLCDANLPRIYDHFKDDGHWYLVMDYIEGETLEEYLTRKGCLSVEEVLDIGIQLSTVLAHLHRHQPPIIFRDLKPANVMRTADGDLYLIDFGIARHFKPGQARDTAAFGSMGYAAPEQFGSAQTTPQSDIFSLGATLHQLLSGTDPSQVPFVFAPFSSASISAALESLVLRMVKTVPGERPANMVEVKQELQRIAAQTIGAPSLAKDASSSSSPVKQKGRQSRRKSALPPTSLSTPGDSLANRSSSPSPATMASSISSAPSSANVSVQSVVSPARQHCSLRYGGSSFFFIALSVATAGIGIWWLSSPLYPFNDLDREGGFFYIVVPLVLGLLFIATALAQSRIQSMLKKHGVTVNGHIINHYIDNSGKQASYSVTYNYECNGQTYSRKIKVSKDQYEAWDKGTSVSVCYLPEKPQVSRLTQMGSEVGSKVGCAILCFLIPLCVISMVILSNHR
jgi:serine/threonine protein kinase